MHRFSRTVWFPSHNHMASLQYICRDIYVVKRLLILFITACTVAPLYGQVLRFSQQVDANGTPLQPGTSFTLAKQGDRITFHLQLPPAKQYDRVHFDLYLLDDKKEIYHASVQVAGQTGPWIAKEIAFYKPGRYRVYVFDDKEQELVRGEVDVRIGGH